jgi:RimJ/RimL family protein N-acetyltransferase
MWAIELAGGGEIVGLCGFFPREGDSTELGYVIRADEWGQGLAPEVASAAVGAGFSAVATIRNTNARSLAVARRIGLMQEGTVTDERGTLLVFPRALQGHDPSRSQPAIRLGAPPSGRRPQAAQRAWRSQTGCPLR